MPESCSRRAYTRYEATRGSARRTAKDGTWQFRVGGGYDEVTAKYLVHTRIWPEPGSNARDNERARTRALAAFVAEVEVDRGPGDGSKSFILLIDCWLSHHEAEHSPSTQRTYKGYVDRGIRDGIGKIPVGELTAVHLDRLYTLLRKRKMEPASIRQVHSICRRALEQGKKWGWIDVNVATLASPPKARRKEISPPTTEVLQALIATAMKSDRTFGTLLQVAAVTSARRGELVGLRWADVDLTGQTITIRRAVIDVGRRLQEKDTKTHAVRQLPIPSGLVAALEDYRGYLEQRARDGHSRPSKNAFLFPAQARRAISLDGLRPIKPEQVTGGFRRACTTLGVQCRFHDIRHLGASAMIAEGVDPVTVASLLGHASVSTTTNIYAHPLAEVQRRATDVLGDKFVPAPPPPAELTEGVSCP